MKDIIAITQSQIDSDQVDTVNARDLHAFLKVKSRFADWIKNRIRDFGFEENQDFVTVSKFLETGGRQIEYFLSLNMAKELSMVERNARANKPERIS